MPLPKPSPPRRSGRVASDLTPTHDKKPYGRERSGNQFMLHIEPTTPTQVSDAQRALTLLNERYAVPFADTVQVWAMLGLDRRP